METFLLQVFAGLSNGGIYASIALALVMVYKATEDLNFAQGEMAMFATYVAWALIHAGLSYWAAFVLTVVISFVGGIVIERVLLRPMEGKSVLSMIIIYLGLFFIFNSLAGFIWGYTIKTFPSPFPSGSPFTSGLVSSHQIGSIAVTFCMMILLYLFFRFTSLGLAMRAVAQNHASSRLVGIRVGWMLALGWGLASVIGAIAGMMIAPAVYLDPYMMDGILIYGFTGALLGGIDNPWGAVIGGFIVGVLENLLGAYVIGDELKLFAALVLIVAVLLVKPNGLFGRTLVSRV